MKKRKFNRTLIRMKIFDLYIRIDRSKKISDGKDSQEVLLITKKGIKEKVRLE